MHTPCPFPPLPLLFFVHGVVFFCGRTLRLACDLPMKKPGEAFTLPGFFFWGVTVFSWVLSFALSVAFRCCVCVAFSGRPRDDAHFSSCRSCVSALLRQPAFLWFTPSTKCQLSPSSSLGKDCLHHSQRYFSPCLRKVPTLAQ